LYNQVRTIITGNFYTYAILSKFLAKKYKSAAILVYMTY
jgi:hypothetical protein